MSAGMDTMINPHNNAKDAPNSNPVLYRALFMNEPI
jgi:hypothetical protein